MKLKLVAQEEMDNVNMDISRSLAEKWIWDKCLYGHEEVFKKNIKNIKNIEPLEDV